MDETRWQAFQQKREAIAQLQTDLTKQWVRAGTDKAQEAKQLWGKELKKRSQYDGLIMSARS